MNNRLNLVQVTMTSLLFVQTLCAQAGAPPARIVSVTVDPNQAVVLHLRPGYVSSIRVLDDVSSVVLGDPRSFKAEHSEAEPHLVFFRPTGSKLARTNALITTKSGHEIPLTLLSEENVDSPDPVDYVLTCEHPHNLLIAPSAPSFMVGETKAMVSGDLPSGGPLPRAIDREAVPKIESITRPRWHGKTLQLALGEPIERGQEMIVPFTVRNSSAGPIEVLPPQIELIGKSRDKHHSSVKAEPVAIKDYWVERMQLGPGAKTDGIVLFERPSFKQSRERLLLSVAEAEAVDLPVLVPIAFVAPSTEVPNDRLQ